MVKRVTSLRGKGRTVTQVCVDSGCTSGSPFLEVWRLDPPKGPSWKTWQPVLRAGKISNIFRDLEIFSSPKNFT